MSCYNAEQFLHDAIESVLNQAYNNFEFIIINDGSTDSTLEIIKSFNDDRIILINQENRGLAYSLNRGIEKSKGAYIARIDADDICLPNRFKKQIKYLQKHPEVDVLGGAVNYINDKGEILGRSFPLTWGSVIHYAIQNWGNVIAHPTVMIRRSALKKYGTYSEKMRFKQDYHLWNKYIRKGAMLKNLSDVLINYRITDHAISSKYQITKNNYSYFRQILEQDEPSEDLIKKLHESIKNTPVPKRKEEYKKLDNRIYKILKHLYFLPIEELICFGKNTYSFIKMRLENSQK